MNMDLGIVVVIIVVLAVAIGIVVAVARRAHPPIRVGILHSLSGTMAFSESAVVDATLLAIEELNASGGLLGRMIEPVVVDGASNPDVFDLEAEKLITESKVDVVFGCWTSASRKTVKPIFERHDHLLVYPVQYEGLESSPNIIYTGSAPNQQIVPAVLWAVRNLGKRIYLVGSDYVFPRTANAIIRHQAEVLWGHVVGEKYLVLGSQDVSEVIADIQAAKPDVIMNTINGDSNIAFFRELRAAESAGEKVPVISFSIAEQELTEMPLQGMIGDFTAWTYFQNIEREENQAFVSKFKARYGENRVTSDPMEAAYFGVHLWAQAVRVAKTSNVRAVRTAFLGQSIQAPQGTIYVDPETRHTWKAARIGRIRKDGQFSIVWQTEKSIRPEPFPTFRSRSEWESYLNDLYNRYGGHWANTGTSVIADPPAPKRETKEMPTTRVHSPGIPVGQ